MVNVAEEVKNPRRNLPLAIAIALGLASLLYVIVALVVVLALEPTELAGERAPLARLLASAGHSTTVIGAISLVAIVNGALIQIIMASRMIYGMALQHNAPAAFAAINARTRTPVRATALAAALVLALALWLPLVTLAQLTSTITLVVFIVINAALWRLKRRGPGPAGTFTLPRWVPALGALLCAVFLLLQLLAALRA
jgi:amino acid transporter